MYIVTLKFILSYCFLCFSRVLSPWKIRELKKELEKRGKMTDEMEAQQRNLTKESEVHQEQSRALQQVT